MLPNIAQKFPILEIIKPMAEMTNVPQPMRLKFNLDNLLKS